MDLPNFYNSIDQTFNTLTELLSGSPFSKRNPFHTGNIAYIRDNKPQVKTVVIRKWVNDLSSLYFHTDIRSQKIKAFTQNNHVMMHFYNSDLKIQLILSGCVTIHHNNHISDNAWKNSSIMSQRCYAVCLAPSERMPDSYNDYLFPQDTIDADFFPLKGYENFSVIQLDIDAIEWLYLHHHGNRRIYFQKKDNHFIGEWLVP